MADCQAPTRTHSQHEMSAPSSTTPTSAEALAELGSEAPTQVVPAAPRPPPLWKIHDLPVPIRTYPLPSFYPSNPLSFFYVAYTWIRQTLSPPPREPSIIHQGVWSARTRSVHITDPKSIRALWEQGFYGKGHLSRSEPNWFKREQARSGAYSNHVAEIHTVNRREERKKMKWDRARKEQEAIHKTRLQEAWVAPVGPKELLALPNSLKDIEEAVITNGIANGLALANGAAHENISSTTSGGPMSFEADANFPFPMPNGTQRPDSLLSTSSSTSNSPEDSRSPLKRRKSVRFSPKVESTTFQHSDPPSPNNCTGNGSGKVPDGILTNGSSAGGSLSQDSRPEPLLKGQTLLATNAKRATYTEDKEHLQLTLEEAFWLAFALGVLEVKDETTDARISVDSLFGLCRQYSYFPPRTANLQPDDPFLIHYAVFHHFRSLGWVARPGIKFGCDWLLYNRGPAFNHAEFAVVVLPSFSDPYWKARGRNAPEKSWQWLHLVNRVQSHALKTLVMVYVEVPPPVDYGVEIDGVADHLDIPSILKRYKVKEFMVKRWLSNRNRD